MMTLENTITSDDKQPIRTLGGFVGCQPLIPSGVRGRKTLCGYVRVMHDDGIRYLSGGSEFGGFSKDH